MDCIYTFTALSTLPWSKIKTLHADLHDDERGVPCASSSSSSFTIGPHLCRWKDIIIYILCIFSYILTSTRRSICISPTIPYILRYLFSTQQCSQEYIGTFSKIIIECGRLLYILLILVIAFPFCLSLV